MAAQWTWALCDATGSPLGELTTAQGQQITFARNSYAEATCAISHEDAAAALVLGALNNTGTPLLRCYRNGLARFNGYLAPFTEDASDTSLMSLVFRSPFGRLVGDGSAAGRFTAASLVYAAPGTDAGSIAVDMLNTANADAATGLIPGTLIPTKARERTYQYANVGNSIVDLSAVLDGFDFTETFLNGQGATLAQLDILDRLGGDQPNARFEYGPDTLANVQAFSRTTASPINHVTAVGSSSDATVVATAQDAASIAQYGKWPMLVTFSDVSVLATLQDKANALLRPRPVKTITLTPDALLAPKPWDDYFLGDTVRVYARRGALVEDLRVRVNGFTVVIDENGNEATQIADPQTPEEEATIRANLAVEVTT